MYLASVILILVVLPAACVIGEALLAPGHGNAATLVGRWYVFWAVGIRLVLAGIRQTIRPRFTAAIFGVEDPRSLAIIREVGFGNLSIGVLGVGAIFRTGWILPAAIAGGLYYALAGLGHLPRPDKNANERIAMISDGFAFLVLAAVVAGVCAS